MLNMRAGAASWHCGWPGRGRAGRSSGGHFEPDKVFDSMHNGSFTPAVSTTVRVANCITTCLCYFCTRSCLLNFTRLSSRLPPSSPMITQQLGRAHWMAVGCIPYSTSCAVQGGTILFQGCLLHRALLFGVQCSYRGLDLLLHAGCGLTKLQCWVAPASPPGCNSSSVEAGIYGRAEPCLSSCGAT